MMTNSNLLVAQKNFAEYLNRACQVIGHSFMTISRLFECKEVHVTHYPYKKFNKVMEIRFDVLTLSCLFDENDICNSSFLFLDNLDDLKHYIDYCDKTYTYDSQLNGWIVENCCLRVNPYRGDYFFSLLPN